MTCREFIEFLVDYLEGGLPDEEKQLFDHHMNVCADCAAYVDGYLQTIKLGKAAFERSDDEVPDEVPEDLVAAILRARGKSGDSKR